MAGADEREGRGLSVLGPVAAFAFAGLAVVALIGMAVVWVAHRDATGSAIAEARDVTVTDARAAVVPALQDGLLEGDETARSTMDQVVRRRVLTDRVVRVKIWASDGTIVYSDATTLQGRRFALGRDELAALRGGRAKADVSNLTHPENVLERSFGKLLEVYVGVRTPAGQPLLFEAYLRFSSVATSADRTFVSMLPALVGGLALVFALQVPLAWSLASRVARSRSEERRLLRRAVEAGEIERRHIAADLHDGVVQALVGTSLTLHAAAEEARRDGAHSAATVVETAAGELRQGVRDLRSLIVAIAPPRLHEEGLPAALADLVSLLSARGIATELRLDAGVRLPPEQETLLYRTAQEALRNVVRHARADRVEVGLSRRNGTVELHVEDNGVGFSPDEFADRQSDGHVGLRLLSDLATEAGGHLAVTGRPDRGTQVHLEIPAR